MCRVYQCFWIAAAALSAFSSASVEAQVAEPEKCPAFMGIPGFSDPQDKTIHRCNLDNAPALLSSLEQLPTPMYARGAHGTLSVVIDPDGRVNRDLTRYWSWGGNWEPTAGWIVSIDSFFHRKLLEAVKQFEYEIGKKDARAVRYGSDLTISTGTRADTISERLTWRYVRGTLEDSLIGTWEATAPDPPFSTDQIAAIARSVTYTLREMQVLLPDRWNYCVLFEGAASQAIQETIQELLYPATDPLGITSPGTPGCEGDVDYMRYRMSDPQRAGGGRTVVHASGDLLRNWPPGLDGRWWRAWIAECVVPDVAEDSHGTECGIRPVYSDDPVVDGRGRSLFESPAREDAPVKFAVEVTTSGAFHTDTIWSSIPDVPSLEDRTVFRDVTQCTGTTTWVALADWPGGGEFVFSLRLPIDSMSADWIDVTEVRRPGADFQFPGIECPASESFVQPLALFTLGGIGQPLRGPVRFCMNEPQCRQSFLVEPGVHELAAEPHMKFRLADIRESARRGEQVHLRLSIDRTIPGLIPIVVARTPEIEGAWMFSEHQDEKFDFRVNNDPPFPLETEFLIYLSRAGER